MTIYTHIGVGNDLKTVTEALCGTSLKGGVWYDVAVIPIFLDHWEADENSKIYPRCTICAGLACKHCGLWEPNHVEGKCMFHATEYEPIRGFTVVNRAPPITAETIGLPSGRTYEGEA
jgi:hypothetical protein